MINNKNNIHNKAKEILNGLSKEDIHLKAKKYKKNNVIGFSILGGLSTLLLIVYLCLVPIFLKEDPDIGSAIFVLIILIVSASIPFIFIITTIKKTDETLALSSIKKDLAQSLNGNILFTYDNIPSNKFNINKTISISTKGFFSTKLLIDNTNKMFTFSKLKKYSSIYNFSDIINYEVYENGSSKVKGTAGKALIGGAFFGLGGMIVGSSMGKNVKEKCNQLQLIIRLNNVYNPQIVLTYIDNGDYDKTDFTYKELRSNLQEVCSTLEVMINSKEVNPVAETTNDNKQVEQKTTREQLQELKEMLEEGLITQEEFEQKKKQILGLQ